MFDDDYESPRDWDNLGVMVCGHRRYNLGDKQIPAHYYNDNGEYIEITSMAEIKDWIEHTYGTIAVILPLGLYDHSGITMYVGNTHDRWDGSAIGYIFVTKEQLRKEYGTKRITKKILQTAEKVLRGEIETFDKYLTGQVFGYQINHNTEDSIQDSCYGYYDEQDAIAEAKSIIDYRLKQEQEKKEKKLKSYIKSSVPLQYRTF